LELPGPVSGLVAYRTADRAAGFMLKFLGQEGRDVLQRLLDDQAALEAEIGQPIAFQVRTTAGDDYRTVGEIQINWKPEIDAERTDAAQLKWLLRTANALVNALRPRLGS
jgi:hypothetical protein